MFYDFIRVSLVTGILILLLLLFFRLVRGRYAAALKYLIWLVLAIRLMVPVTITLPQKVSSLPAVRTVAETQHQIRQSFTDFAVSDSVTTADSVESVPSTEKAEKTDNTDNAEEINIGAQPEKQSVNWGWVLVWLWGIGAVLFLGYHVLVNYSFRRYIRRWGFPARDRQLKELVLRAKRNCGLGRPLKLLILENVGSPMVVGFLHPVLLLPQENWDATELYYVLRHELTHIKRRDMLYKGLLLLVNAIHWFNPAVWMMRYRAYQDIEICCDMTVVEGATRDVRMCYCETIMATAQRSAGVGMAATFGSTKKSILERFREIFSEKRKKRGIAILLVVLAVAVLAGCSLSLGAALAGEETPAPLQYTPEEPSGAFSESEETASSYYEAEDVDSTIEAMEAISDPETVKAEVLEKIKNGTNSAGAEDEVLEAFAEFLGQHWEDYLTINGDDYSWYIEYDEDDRLTLKVIREEPVANETWYRTFWYENDTVVYGKHMGWLESYKAPDETTLLEDAKTALSGAKNAGKVSEKAMDALATWMKDAVIFLEQYSTWDWNFETVNDEKTVLTCTGTANGSGITPYVTLTYSGKTGEVSSESGNKGSASGNTGCVRYVPESRPEDMEEYMFHEGDVLDYFKKDATEVLSEKGTPERFLKDDDTVNLSYSDATYAFRFCNACQSYHLYEVQFSQGTAFHDISIGDSAEQVLSYFHASGAEPSAGAYLYRYDGDNYAQYVPVADTGLTMVSAESGEMTMYISINQQNTVYNVEYIVYK